MTRKYIARIWTLVYEGDPPPQDPPKLDQEAVNKIVAEERRKAEAKYTKLQEELNALSTKANMTIEERKELEKRLEALNSENLTKEEQFKRQLTKAEKERAAEKEALTQERDTWKTKFATSTIMRSITDAAVEHKAFAPEQIVALLGSNTRLVEVLGDDGKPTGDFEVKVKFADVDDKGKSITLDLTPTEAVKRMKEIEKHMNLFQGTGKGGHGDYNRNRPITDVSALLKDSAAYRKAKADGTFKLT